MAVDNEENFYVYVKFRRDGSPCYVGKGKGQRWRQHDRRTHNKRLQRILDAAIALGCEVPTIKIREGLTEAEALETEIALIRAIGRDRAGPLVNMTDGGEGMSGWKHTEASKRKISANNRARGCSAETRAKMSESRRNAPPIRRKPLTQEQRARISAAKKGKPATRKGFHLSAETKLKLSIAARNRVHKKGYRISAEGRANISAAARRRCLRKQERI